MLIVLSPAKTLDYATPVNTEVFTQPDFVERSAMLIKALQSLSAAEIGALMHISDPLAELNATRYASWNRKSTVSNARQAVLAFNGDVYEGLGASSMEPAQLDYLQRHLRILSGLYGALRPLDLMQPYRLEMGTRLATSGAQDLYAFWGDRVSTALNAVLAERQSSALVNLASAEYFKVVRPGLLRVPVITPVFQDWKNGQYKVISFHAKRARGLMARYAAQHQITEVEQLRDFNQAGYAFDASVSEPAKWVFRRGLAE
ncbi:cytoplasmic iron level regulating protein YaaA (DUF328/UPF0246 family) [Actimicrobium sp. GrIS 1.19]|uniref:peroxide stress protein YaaA n=1 Tax=Actimicrobium sp. GrIS 1.19 TaxID=3071708 RepID=UPI002DFC08F5|nr:cytoplasmic iron level regulating protein YaaA (DUF328/UPF0246 family) [Actimicrobium sp. GrIS 1.19]